MKKRTAAAFIAAMTITTLTACGGPKQLSKSVTVELGKEDGIKVTDILDISKDEAKSAKIDAKKVNFNKEGKYEATITYDKKEYKVTVKIRDTVAPEATVKDSIVVQTGNPVRVTDCISEIKEASGVADAKFKTKPDTAAQAATTETSTEATASDDSGTESAASTEKNASSAVYAVGDVSLSSNDEITYVEAGDYDNSIVVTDNAGNKSEVPVKISVIAPPTINGVTDKTITAGESIDYMAGVTATDSKGADITSSVTVDSSAVKTDTAGSYQATYKVTDQYGLTSGATSNVTVNEKSPVVSDDSNKPQEESNQVAADNGGSSSKSNSSSDKKSNKKNNSGSQSSSSNSNSSSGGGQQSSGSSNSGQQAANNNNGGGSSSGGSSSGGSSAVETPKQDEGDYVTSASGTKLKVDKSKWKYDTSEAGRLGSNGLWANGDAITSNDILAAGEEGYDENAAKYLHMAGYITYLYDGVIQ